MFTEEENAPTPLRSRGTAEPPAVPRRFRRLRRLRHSRQLIAWAFLAPVVIYLVAFFAYPMYRNIDLSVRNYTVEAFVQGNAAFTGLANYRTVIHDPTFVPALVHTLAFTAVSILFQFVIGFGLAVFFAKNFRLSRVLRALFLVPWLLPLIVSASTWSWMLNSNFGVVNAALGWFGIHPVDWLTAPVWALVSVIIANIWIGIPFNLVILYSGLQSIPGDIYEAAMLDGAGGWARFWRVTVPLLKPVIAITLLLGFIYTLRVFDIIWIMTKGGPDNASTTFSTWSYQLSFGNLVPQFGPGSAVANLLIVLTLVFAFIYIAVRRKLDTA